MEVSMGKSDEIMGQTETQQGPTVRFGVSVGRTPPASSNQAYLTVLSSCRSFAR